MSTGNAGRLSENNKTIAAVLGPTPSSDVSHCFGLLHRQVGQKVNVQFWHTTAFALSVMRRSTRWMRGPF